MLNAQERTMAGTWTQKLYEKILEELANLRLEKSLQYGDAYFEDKDEEFMLTLLYGDLHRKMIRIEQVVRKQSYLEAPDTMEWVRDTYMDLANYAIMCTMILDLARGAEDRNHLRQWSLDVQVNSDRPTVDADQEMLDSTAPTAVASTGQQGRIYRDKVPGSWCVGFTDADGRSSVGWFLPNMGPTGVLPFKRQTNQLSQVAIYSTSPEQTKHVLEKIFNRPITWLEDTVHSIGKVGTRPHEERNSADLAFNYDLSMMEFEIINYKYGPNWVEDAYGSFPSPVVAHVGVYVDSMDQWRARLMDLGYQIVQEVKTQDHTSQHLVDSRVRYHYVIVDTRADLGFFLKLIERIEPIDG